MERDRGLMKMKTLLSILALFVGVFAAVAAHAEQQFPDLCCYGGVSTGTANAQIIAIPNFTAMPQAAVEFSWTPGAGLTNSGAATLTIKNPNNGALTSGPITILKKSGS